MKLKFKFKRSPARDWYTMLALTIILIAGAFLPYIYLTHQVDNLELAGPDNPDKKPPFSSADLQQATKQLTDWQGQFDQSGSSTKAVADPGL